MVKNKKIKKTYRLDEVTVERIRILREYYSSKGLDLSDAQLIQHAISLAMDISINESGAAEW